MAQAIKKIQELQGAVHQLEDRLQLERRLREDAEQNVELLQSKMLEDLVHLESTGVLTKGESEVIVAQILELDRVEARDMLEDVRHTNLTITIRVTTSGRPGVDVLPPRAVSALLSDLSDGLGVKIKTLHSEIALD